MCSDHLIITTIYLKFKKHNILELLPDELAPTLQALYEANRYRNEQILQQIDAITAELNKENIEPVFLKGTANLLDGLYSDVGERMIGDIDFLVKEEDYLKAAEKLRSLGYFNQSQLDGTFLLEKHHHYASLTKIGAPAAVEIHSVPVIAKYARHFTAEMVFAQRKAVARKSNVYVPSDNHKVILNFIHSQLSNSGYKLMNTPFRDMYDACLLAQRVNLNEVPELVEEKQKARVYFHLVNQTFQLNNRTNDPNLSGNKKYITKFNWYMDHPGFYNLYFQMHLMIRRIFKVYPEILIHTIYSKPHRKFVWLRMKKLLFV